MADLISREAAIDYLMTNMGWCDEDGYEVDDADEKRDIITNFMNGVPAVDAAPIVHGRWRALKDGSLECTNCLRICPHDVNCYGNIISNYKGNYCPFCGAKMDSERRDSE